LPVTVKLGTPLRKFAEGRRQLDVPAGTVESVLGAVTEQCPDLRARLFGDDGRLRPTMRVFVGQMDLASVGGMAGAVEDGTVVSIVPPVAGA
jgi:molybdopterin converting factor small subunit